MTDLAIHVEGLGKLYRIGQREPYKSLRDDLSAAIYAPLRHMGLMLNGRKSKISDQPTENTIWALKDVSFEVRRGEVIGIIGRNGAGDDVSPYHLAVGVLV